MLNPKTVVGNESFGAFECCKTIIPFCVLYTLEYFLLQHCSRESFNNILMFKPPKYFAIITIVSISAGLGCVDRSGQNRLSVDHRLTARTAPVDEALTTHGFDQSKQNGVTAGVENSSLSSVIAVYPAEKGNTFEGLVKERLVSCREVGFEKCGLPLSAKPQIAKNQDQVRIINGLAGNVIVSWLDKINKRGDYFGANNDYLAYFGDGWRRHGAPQWNGDANAGFLWVNHEYLGPTEISSPGFPQLKSAPRGDYLILAQHLAAANKLPIGDVDRNVYWTQLNVNKLIKEAKKHIGGSWIRIARDSMGRWRMNPENAANQRYTADASTLFELTGPFASNLSGKGKVIPGTLANCSGGTTPWGSILTAEENNHVFLGDPEPAFSTEGIVKTGLGFDAGGVINPDYSPKSGYHFTASSDRQPGIDNYGWATEIDPGIKPDTPYDPASGVGHGKHSALGQARWENFSFSIDSSWNLIDGAPLVIYYADDRRGGRVHKFVSRGVYRADMPKREIRELLTAGNVYVSQLDGVSIKDGYSMVSTGAAPTKSGRHFGRWIELSLDNNRDIAPNHDAAGEFAAIDENGDEERVSYNNAADTSVGVALKDRFWNGLGGFDTQAKVLANLFTAATKIGVFEQNRPEDVEWNPLNKTLYVAYTNHGKKIWLDQKGRLANNEGKRADEVGRIWAFQESDAANPAASLNFQFWEVAAGNSSFCDDPDSLSFARPDNIAIDKNGGLWFSTDGQYSLSDGECSDALYYMAMDPQSGSGKAVRVLTVPTGAEATGPAFNSDMVTLFLSVQHPGESDEAMWPMAANGNLPIENVPTPSAGTD